MKKYIILCLVYLILSSVSAQESTVPDLTGLNIPQAAAALNKVGLRLGKEESLPSADGVESGAIISQSVAPGSLVAAGSSVDIGIIRIPNLAVIYDDNDLTLVSSSANVADITEMRFASTEGTPTSFPATRWSSALLDGRCLQLWSVPRNSAKDLPECDSIQGWLTTRDTSVHFWTQANGVQNFAVLEGGVERATCPAAPVGSGPMRCDFYYGGASSAENIVPYIYFIYTTDTFIVINSSEDKWMPVDRTVVYNNNPQLAAPGGGTLGNPEAYGNPDVVADITRLAPGQCILFTMANPAGEPPQSCDVIVRLDLGPELAFWPYEFEVESATDGLKRACPPAVADRPTVCIMPQ